MSNGGLAGPGLQDYGAWAYHLQGAYPTFIGSSTVSAQGSLVQHDTGYTYPTERGSVLPSPRGRVPWSVSFPRDPSTGAALPNAQDPILAGSRWDPYGFTVPQWPEDPFAIDRANALGGVAVAMAHSIRKLAAAAYIRSRRRRLLGVGI